MNPDNTPVSMAAFRSAALPAAALPTDFSAAVLDEIELGLIVCTASGQSQTSNWCARQELASGRLLRHDQGVVRVAAQSSASLESAVRNAALHGRRQLLWLSHGDDQLWLCVAPLQRAAAPEPMALLLLGRRGLCSALGAELLGSVHGLTQAERRVLGGLLRQRTPNELADDLNVALSTVRSHLKSIRAKFGVCSIDALLTRAAELPPLAAALRICAPIARSQPNAERSALAAA
jgi:DNA-binding CsgD family transcriptional regulator